MRILIIILVVLLCCIVSGQIMVGVVSEDYKNGMIAHDYEVAGYLYRHAPQLQREISYAFTAEKSGNDIAAGEKVLQAAGYNANTDKNHIPGIRSFHRKYSILVLALSLGFSLVILAVLFLFVHVRERKLEEANAYIAEFMSGNHAIRLKGFVI